MAFDISPMIHIQAQQQRVLAGGGSGNATPPSGNGPGPSSSGNSAFGMSGMLDFVQFSNQLNSQLNAQAAARPSFSQLREHAESSLENPWPRHDIQLNPRTEAVVLDGFMPEPGSTQPAHGFGVAAVVREQTGLADDQIALVSDTPFGGTPSAQPLLRAPGPESASERLDSYIELSVANSLSNTNNALEAIADQDAPNLKGVNYSTGLSTLTSFNALSSVALDYTQNGRPTLTEDGKVIFDGLGLPHETTGATMREFAERGMARIGRIQDESPLVGAQLDRHEDLSRELADRGVHYTVSAGNDGETIGMYRGAGVQVPDSADDNLYANPHNVTVGSLDTRGTADPSDDIMAAHTSRDPEIDFLAPGVNRSIQVFGQQHIVDGTSYASPDIMSRLVNISRQNPGLPTSAVQNLLHNSAGPAVPGYDYSAIR